MMKHTNRPVTSREYKLMLNVDRFKDREHSAKSFWGLVEYLVERQCGKVVKRQDKEFVRRTWYLDTAWFALRQHGFVLRLREEMDKSPRYKITIKYRGPDRYVSATRDVSVSEEMEEEIESEDGKAEIDPKFEEDILPPFYSKFARSTSVKTRKLPELGAVGQMLAVFPGLKVLKIPACTPLDTVRGFYAHEVARWIGQFEFGGEPTIKACLSFWYPPEHEGESPLVAEFSFDYDLPDKDSIDRDKLEQFPIEAVQGADRLFRVLQDQSGWFDLNATTKTAYVYTEF